MATEDVVGHELTHAVEWRAGFGAPKYAYRSGALNESLADTFAAFLQTGPARWTMGEGSARGAPRHDQPARARDACSGVHSTASLRTEGAGCSPTLRCAEGFFCRRDRCTCVSADCDYGHVHANSGILNHAVWLAAEGGTHVTEGTAVDGVGVPKLERVLFEAMSLLSPSTRFDGWRDDVLLACRALVDEGVSVPGGGAIEHRDCGRIVNAFAAVGIGTRDRDEDSFDDDHDNCPIDYNPEQRPDDECVRDPYLHCRAWRYGLAFDRFLEGVDIGFERNQVDAAIMVSRCAFGNRDYLTAEDVARSAASRGSPGEAAIAWFIAEYAAERMGRGSEGYRTSGLAAAEGSGMCSSISDADERAGCAGFQRAGTRAGLERE
ncbi:MAG: M4 family metallopeptidase [Sandaracinaceae bacterium]